MKSKYIAVLLLLCIVLAGCTEKGAQAEKDSEGEAPVAEDRISPIIDREGADPFVMLYGERYLYTKTTGDHISLGSADSIQTLGASELRCIYDPGAELKDLWAPEIWRLDDVWYIYFAAVIPGEEMHHMFVLSNESEDPMQGEWKCCILKGMDDKFAIDGTIMELSDRRYFLWSGWAGYENVRQDIYLAEMISPTEVVEEKILLSSPELDWEKNGNPLVNEGPEVILRKHTVNLVYSASGSWTDEYCLGLLTMDSGTDPKNPDNWIKHEQPLMSKDFDVYGPGHNSFTTSVDGREDLVIYHAARWMGAGWNRSVRYGYVDFNEEGIIQTIPVKSGEALEKIPSGEQPVLVYSAEHFNLSGDLELCEDAGGQYVAGMISTKDTAGVVVRTEETKDIYVTVFVKVDDLLDGVISSLEVRLNGEAKSQEIYAGENYQPLYFSFPLEKGENVLELRSDIGGSELKISRIEIREGN